MPCAGDEEIACGETALSLLGRYIHVAASERATFSLRFSSFALFRVLLLLFAWWGLMGPEGTHHAQFVPSCCPETYFCRTRLESACSARR